MAARDLPVEACGVFGGFGHDGIAGLLYRGLLALQHRGQEGAGVVVADGAAFRAVKGAGLVSDVLTRRAEKNLAGRLGIGHVRYSTTGAARVENLQPLVVECVDGAWAVAHNGNLINAHRLRRRYQEAGAIFQTGTDSEVLVHLLADPLFRSRPHRVARALAELKGSFSFLLLTPDCLMAARDPHGFRPLSLGRIGPATVFASETCAFAQTGAAFERDVAAGELITVNRAGRTTRVFSDPPAHLSQCVFELVYFARPDSTVFGHNVHGVRLRYGERLAREHPVDADVVIPIPDSGSSAALGYCRSSGIPMDFGFIRNHYVGRTFIMPEADDRARNVDLKLSLIPQVVAGRRVVVVDDSIVRGTTARQRVSLLREAGAREVHFRVSCPPIAHPCRYGIDFQTREELIAGTHGVEDIRAFLHADSLGYLSLEGLLSPFERPADFCTACFTGEYPLAADGPCGKHVLENSPPAGSQTGRGDETQ